MIWVKGLPLPPSVNEYLMPVAGKPKVNKFGRTYFTGHMTKTKVFRDFQERMLLWQSNNRKAHTILVSEINEYKKKCEEHGRTFALKIDCFFVFDVGRVYTKDHKVKQLDADNRLKPMRDALANMLMIDDRYFFTGECEKLTTHSKELECTVLRISQMAPRTLEDLNQQIKMEIASTPDSFASASK